MRFLVNEPEGLVFTQNAIASDFASTHLFKLGLPCVLLLEYMFSLLNQKKKKLSSEDAKKCPNVLLFGIIDSEHMMQIHSSTKTFWEVAVSPGLVKGGGGQGGTKYRGPSCFEGPAHYKFFLGTHAKKYWRNYVFAMLRPTLSVRSREGAMGRHVSPNKNSRPPSKEKKFVLGWMPKRPTQ